MEFISKIVEYVPVALAVLGALSVAAGAIAKVTPNKTDDGIVAKVESMLAYAATLFMKKPASAPKPE